MTSGPAHPTRLILRNRRAPQGWEIGLSVAGTGLVLAGLLLRGAPLGPLLGIAGVLAVLPLLWATRPGPVTVIDRAAGRITEKNALGRVTRSAEFKRIDGVGCDRVSLPARTPDGPGLVIHRTVLLTGGAPVPVRGFGAPGPARELKAQIERWLAESPTPQAAL
ncbi:hypothetical protein [Vannielia litorea]|uniref:hypothetical protein n=1 Tax=Vannielia litorea TaxID=1217970 RepID=UPI001BD04FAF|nr:hypothetical protein [Vannielia litorea]MBS8226573.1 hypothetical protein [Vannielia litorea]